MNICIVFCFLFKFPVETTVIVRCVKMSQFHRHFPYWLLNQIQLKQFSHSLVPTLVLPWKLKAFCQHFPSIQHPPCSQIYLKKLTSLPFPTLGNAKATLYPKTNSMLLKQKHLLKWRWLWRRNTYKESGNSCRISACSCTSTTVFQ